MTDPRSARTARRAATAAGLLCGLLLSAACAPAPVSAPAPAPSAAQEPPCVRQLTTYLQDHLDGQPDLGDYQELGLSAAEARALRALRRQADELRGSGPLPSGWVAERARASCAEIERSEATSSPKPPGWP
ncbi:hypothetical protein ACGFX4_13265 [Kitasatospora sp. NPDC048365]|uniref:hypothetical protein n=1 Tax=Kitasatospora sp. NPDC048365 TaxID=3364050 RepID=UPI00371F4678